MYMEDIEFELPPEWQVSNVDITICKRKIFLSILTPTIICLKLLVKL